MVVTPHTKTQVQRSVGSEESESENKRTDGQTYGQTNATDCFNIPANAVGN